MAAVAFAAPEVFEKTLLRTTLGAAVGGMLGAVLLPASVPVLTLVGALAALGTRRSALPLGLVGLVAGLVSASSSARPLFALLVGGAVAGAGIALARFLAPSMDGLRLSGMRLAAVALGGAAALAVGSETAAVFDSHALFTTLLPFPLAAGARAALVGFFFGLSGSALHITPGVDPVETLHAKAAKELTGELARMAEQAIALYRKCKEALARAPDNAARAHVGRALADVTGRALELARRWHAVDQELGDRAEGEVARRMAEVQRLASTTSDATAKRQLQAAERALHGELEQIQRIRAGRERVLARLHADLAILERTRFALLALRVTDAQLMATELAQLSENLGAMGRDMDVESQAIDEALRAALAPAPLGTPVVPVASEPSHEAPAPSQPVKPSEPTS